MAETTSKEIPMGSAASAYTRMRSDRDPYLQRARRNSKLTVPSLFRETGDSGSTDEEVPWNTFGAYCITNLASKVVGALFPVGRAPMKLGASQAARQDLLQIEDAEQREELRQRIDTGLSRVEGEFVECVEEDGDRAKMTVAAKKMIVGGQHGFEFYEDGTLRGIPLERHCTMRDPSGNLLEFAIEDPLSYATLPPHIQSLVQEAGFEVSTQAAKTSINVYTHGVLQALAPYSKPVWKVNQEVYGQTVPDSEAIFYPDFLPYLFVPWTLLDGEHYGRSYVEDYEGDLLTVEGNTQTITEGSAAMANFIRYVHPAGLTNKKAVAEARNGDVLTGRSEDVTTNDARAAANFQSAQWVTEQALSRLQRAFLLASRRQGERVTAEEIRGDAQELEEVLGGVYSQQGISWQGPYVRLKLNYLQKAKRVTPLPKNSVKVTIIAGLGALGRNAEMVALDGFLSGASELLGPEQLFQTLGPNAMRTYLKRRAAALNINTDGLIPSDAEGQQLDAQNMQKQMMQQLGPEAIKQVGQNLTSNQVESTRSDTALQVAETKTPAQQGA